MGKGVRARRERQKEQEAFHLTRPQEKAMHKEINAQILKKDTQYRLDMDAAVLWVLHKEFGFGAARLRRFFDRFDVIHEKLREHYQLDDNTNTWLCRYLLKEEVGVDVEEWEREAAKEHGK